MTGTGVNDLSHVRVSSGRTSTCPSRQAVAAVTADLDRLGIGEHWTVTRTHRQHLAVVDRRVPLHSGWCQALTVPEALWPEHSDLCALVKWHPDPVWSGMAGGARWDEQVRVTATSLQAVGYAVQQPGPRPAPGCRSADLLVFRLLVGMGAGPVPTDGWAHLERYPARPGWSASEDVRDALSTAARSSSARGVQGFYVRDLPRVLWPPYTLMTCVAGWIPQGCTDPVLWRRAMSNLRALLPGEYTVLEQHRPWAPGMDESPYLIVCRTLPSSRTG